MLNVVFFWALVLDTSRNPLLVVRCSWPIYTIIFFVDILDVRFTKYFGCV